MTAAMDPAGSASGRTSDFSDDNLKPPNIVPMKYGRNQRTVLRWDDTQHLSKLAEQV